MKDIFLTATFRDNWNREYNPKLIELLESAGYTVYAPQRDTDQSGNRKKTFLQNIEGIDNARMALGLGSVKQSSNWGFEVGYAYKGNKPILILTDNSHPVDLMAEGAVHKIMNVENLDDVDSYKDELLRSISGFLS